ncbi:hypothetical protein JR316_0010663 [Psilocybe cubensis]|uniref:Glycoside hydrolase family 78 protein n=2 Tax=Psilocybe cubensis TaxID=181762 RepID=A0A8H7XTG1_PSICU|nr:hypothetical protein JR316_0010663 [Psilocybe cubensis]KAH9476748.1 hypothetical protein JR316_0010663 [Psilocybe cubensis]
MALEEPPLRGQVVMRLGFFLLFVLLGLDLSYASAPSGPWDAFNLAPESKTVYPAAIHSSHGTVKNSNLLVKNKGKASLSTNGSWIALDFGIEVGGLISLNLNDNPSPSSFSLSFTESPAFIRPSASDDSSFPSANTTYDGVLQVSVPAHAGYWVQPASSLRGGFRYLTVVSNSENDITLSNVSCAISFVPHLENMRDYAGYFYAKDPQSKDEDLLTKSDMGIAVPTQFVSTNDLIPTRNALSTMFAAINPKTGALPESGPPLSQQGSDTYHAWTLIGTYNYVLFSGDVEWLQGVWANYTKAVAFLEGKVDGTGLMDVTGLRDWARQGGGGYNAEGNAILYKVLTTASSLASTMSLPSLSSTYLQNATALKSAFNNAFWLPSKGMYRDNQTTTLCPQDANSFAILFNLTEREEQKRMVSDGLVRNWNGIGPVAPELPDTISPFISGFEIQAHFEAGNDARAMELIRRTWGYMLTTDLSVQSTLLEGFTANGSLAYRYNHGYNDDPAYTSHSHGWSSGPTPALTFYVLGLTLTELQGRTWALAPHFGGGLRAAEGGFQTGLGWFGVKWSAVFGEQGEVESLMMSVETPEGTNGVVMLPKGINGWIAVDGSRLENLSLQDSRGVTLRLIGGKHEIQVQPV